MTPGQTVFVVDATTTRQISDLNAKVDRLMEIIGTAVRRSDEENPWLTAKAFCQKYSMGRSTLTRRMQEEPCRIEVLDPNEKIKKYRWSEEVAR